jgi:hypothetical protein
MFTVILTASLTLAGCEKTESDPCKKTQWENAVDRIVNIRISSEITSFSHENQVYTLSQATSVTFTGSVTKYYCSGEKSGSFNFKTVLYPENGSISLTRVKIGGPFQFLFQNDNDYLAVENRVRLEFPDGTVFRPISGDITKHSFKHILLNANELEYYLQIFIESNTKFEKVSY